jgi:hypothetical protein
MVDILPHPLPNVISQVTPMFLVVNVMRHSQFSAHHWTLHLEDKTIDTPLLRTNSMNRHNKNQYVEGCLLYISWQRYGYLATLKRHGAVTTDRYSALCASSENVFSLIGPYTVN